MPSIQPAADHNEDGPVIGEIEVEVMPWLSEAFGKTSRFTWREKLEDGEPIKALLNRLAKKYEAISRFLYEPSSQELRGEVAVIVNGREIRHLNGLETRLRTGDKITFIPPIAGG